MNVNEYHLKSLQNEIKYYEMKNSSVKEYLNLVRKRDDVLNDLRRSW